MSTQDSHKRLKNWHKNIAEHYGLVLVLLGLAVLYIYLLRPEIAGLWYDDGVYLLGAKALATRQGYRLLSEPGWPGIVKYPPLFSLVLSPIWWMNANFPVNLVWCKGLNLLLGLGALGLVNQLSRRFWGMEAWQALLLILLVGLNPAWLVLVTDVMSEPLYLLLTLLLLWLSTRIHQRGNPPIIREEIALVLLSMVTFYTRTLGLTIIAALSLWLWRQFGTRTATRYILRCVVLCLPWLFWCAQQSLSLYALGHLYVASYNQTYFQELLQEIIKAQGLGPMLWSNLTIFPAALLQALFPMLNRLAKFTGLLPLLALTFLGGLAGLGIQLWRKNASPTLAYLFFYLVACLFWYAHEQYPRLIVPILPILWLGVFRCWQALLNAKWSPWLHSSALSLSLNIGGVLVLIWSSHPWQIASIPKGNAMASNADSALWEDYQATFAAMRQFSSSSDIFWSRYCSLYPLYTNRLVISRNIIPTPQAFTSGELQGGAKAVGKILLRVLSHEKVRYLILEPRNQGRRITETVDIATLNIILASPEHFSPVYQSPHGYIRIYRYIN